MTSLLILFCSGLVAGIFAGLLGIGGGFILVPVLFFVLQDMGVSHDLAIATAIATSLATIVLTGLSSAYKHHRAGYVDLKIVWRLFWWIVGGGFAGAYIATLLSPGFLKFLFAAMTFIMAGYMLYTSTGRRVTFALRPGWLAPLVSLGVVLSSWIGIGGGVFNVPLLMSTGVTLRHAIGTAAAIGPLLALSATLSFMFASPAPELPLVHTGWVVWSAFFVISLASILTAPLGASIAHRLPLKVLSLIFCLFLLTAGLRIMTS